METSFAFDETGYTENSAYFDWCLGQSVQALIEDDAEELAAVLLACRLSWHFNEWDQYAEVNYVRAILHGPMSAIKQIRIEKTEYDDDIADYITWQPNVIAVEKILALVLGPKIKAVELAYQVETSNLPSNWRDELLEIARKRGTTNQGRTVSVQSSQTIQYANLNFRSASEIKIAQALDNKGIMYFANCTARVNRGGDRVNREPDFLVCYNGRWGILEVDGEPFHTPANAAQDHERDRLFEHHGVRFVQHYQAQRCYQEPQQVVTEFLELLVKNG